MSHYRIAPHGASYWKVQRLLFGLLWWDITREIGYGYSELRLFGSEKEAEGFIWGILAEASHLRGARNRAHERRRNIAPRRYP